MISPIGCDGNIYYWRILLKVTDPAGLFRQDEVDLYPDCAGGNTAPTISDTPNQTIAHDTSTGPIGLTVGDTETAVINLVMSGASSNTALVPSGNIVFGGSGATRTVTVTPVAGQSGTATITLTVSDGQFSASDTFLLTVTGPPNTAPTMSNLADLSTNEDTATSAIGFTVGDAETAAGSLTVTGASSNPALVPTGNVVFGGSGAARTVTVTPAANQSGTATITVTVSDGTLTASDTFLLTVTPVNDAPTISDIVNQTSPENATVALPLVASDPDGDSLTYSTMGLPEGLTLHATDGVISGTLSYASAGTYSVTATVSDGAASSSTTFAWTVTDVNRAPVLTVVANQSSAEKATVTLPLGASDPDGTALTYSATGLPAGLSINATTGAIAGTLSYASAGSHTVTATVSDGTLTSSRTFTWTVTNVNREPLLTAVAARTDAENATISLQVVASDPDGDAVTFSAIGLPAGLSINASTGLIDGTLSYASAGKHVVIVLTSDGELVCGNTFTWTVTNVDREPVVTALAGRTDPENATVSLQVVATDPDGDAVTFSAIGLPPGLSINAATGLISGTLSYASAGSPTVTATVSDGTLTSSRTFTWTVTNVNRGPTLTTVSDRADAENATVSLPLVASDPDAEGLTYSATGLPADLNVNPNTGLISGTLSYVSAGTHSVTATVSDGDLTSSQSFTWTVTNVNRAPVLTAIADRTDVENATISLPLVVSDPDGDSADLQCDRAPGADDRPGDRRDRGDPGLRQCRAAHRGHHRL